MARFINALADFLSTVNGFIWTCVIMAIGVAIGALMQFDDLFMLGFNIFLSVAAIAIAGIILVSAARSEAAIHVKLDHLIEFSKATNSAIGIEHKDAEEIEAAREAIEREAQQNLEGLVEREVEEEVSEQLAGKRRPTPAPSGP